MSDSSVSGWVDEFSTPFTAKDVRLTDACLGDAKG